MLTLKTENKIKQYDYMPFDDIPISTISFVIHTNLEIDINKVFAYIPLNPNKYIKSSKKNKKTTEMFSPGSVFGITFGKNRRGSNYKEKKRINRIRKEIITEDEIETPKAKKKKYDYFLHTLQLSMIINNNKLIGIKIPRTGTFHVTGAKTQEQFYEIFELILETLKKCEKYSGEEIIYVKNDTQQKEHINDNSKIHVRFRTIMTNISSNIGYKINRQEFNNYLNSTPNFFSEYRPDKSPSVKVKISVPQSTDDYDYHPDLIETYYTIDGKHTEPKIIQYKNYFNELPIMMKQKERKEKFFSFLVFQSGKYILSAVGLWMKTAYEQFMNITSSNRELFEEIFEEQKHKEEYKEQDECKEDKKEEYKEDYKKDKNIKDDQI